MTSDRGAKRRAQKAERRAQNIRKYARPGDRSAERRARKSEHRAQNIRDYAGSRDSSTASRNYVAGGSSGGDANPAHVLGGLVILFLIMVIFFTVWEVLSWLNGLF